MREGVSEGECQCGVRVSVIGHAFKGEGVRVWGGACQCRREGENHLSNTVLASHTVD